MKKQPFENNQMQTKQEQLIERAMRTGGFVFPQTVLEVEAFERKFGTTDINLPEGLEFPTFLDAKGLKGSESKIIKMTQQNIAMAARNEAGKIPNEILTRMEEDRRKEAQNEEKRKKKK